MNIGGIPNIVGKFGGIVNQVSNLANLFNTAAREEFRFKYEISPLLLKNGIAENMPDKVMPIIQLTQQGGYPINSNGYFANFKVVTGSTLMQNSIGQYPFANQATAGNAIIQQPVNVSLLMYCPANHNYPTDSRSSIIASLIASINSHIQQGGLFVVYTPLYIYDNCVLVGMRDASEGENSAMQNAIIFDFQRPQIMDANEAQGAQNNLMSKISKGEKLS